MVCRKQAGSCAACVNSAYGNIYTPRDDKVSTGFLNLLSSKEIGYCNGTIIYQLIDDLVFKINNETIIIPKCFQTDLASVPRIPIVFLLWGDRAHREAVLHDYLYRVDAKPSVTKTAADCLFKQAMISRGQPWSIYYPMWLGVKLCGGSAYHKLPIGYVFQLD